MKELLEFLPLIAFFGLYPLAGIYAATAGLVVCTIGLTSFQWFKYRHVSRMTLASSGLAVLLGGLTLAAHNDAFIKWKFTVVYWLMGCIAGLSAMIGERTVLERTVGEHLVLPRPVWKKATWALAIYFLLAGAVNVYLIYHFSTPTWMKFKLGMIGVFGVFIFVLFYWLFTQQAPEVNESPPSDSKA
jgi:intracellular septation protein